MLIYFAGSLFSNAEKTFNLRLANTLGQHNFRVFLPQRDGVESGKPLYDNMSKSERRKALFQLDRKKILEADIFLFILDGRIPDEGACVELGIAYEQKQLSSKILLGLHTDIRAAFVGAKLNPMISMALEKTFSTEKALIDYLLKLKH